MGTDGPGERPVGGVAENLGRPDRMRAGAVSGPWRSGPPPAAGAARNAPPRAAGPGPAPATPRRPSAAPRIVPQVEPAPYTHAPARGNSVRIAVTIGLIAAIGIVAAAFFLRPDTSPQSEAPAGQPPAAPLGSPDIIPAPAPAPEAVAEPASGPAPVAPAELPAPAGPLRLRVGPNLPEEQRERIAAALDAAGYGPVQVEVLPFPIAASRVGYYRAEDQAAAAALAEFVGGVLSDPATSVSTRDYGQLLEDTEPGRLDIWIGG